MLHRLGMLISRGWPVVLFAWVIALLLLYVVAPHDSERRDESLSSALPATADTVRARELLQSAFPGVQTHSQACLIVARSDGPLGPEDFLVADRLVAAFSPRDPLPAQDARSDDGAGDSTRWLVSSNVVGVLSHRTPGVGPTLISPESDAGQATLVLLQLRTGLSASEAARVIVEIDTLFKTLALPEHVELGMTGPVLIESDLRQAARLSFERTAWVAGAAITVFCVLVFRMPSLVLTALVTVGAAVFVSWRLPPALSLWINDRVWQAPYGALDISNRFALVVMTGASASFLLLLLLPYRREMFRVRRSHRVLRMIYARSARIVLLGAATAVCGFVAMLMCRMTDYREAGPLLALSVFVALAACLTLAPALLRAWGENVAWPWPPSEEPAADDPPRPRAARLPRWSTERPLATICIATLILLGPALLGMLAPADYDVLSQLPDSMPSVRGSRMLARYFPSGEMGPIVVLAYQKGARFDSRDALWDVIDPLAVELKDFTYRDSRGEVVHPIAGVRSLTDPLGTLPEKGGLMTSLRFHLLRQNTRTQRTYLAHGHDMLGEATRFDLVPYYNPFSQESMRLLDHVEQTLRDKSDDPESPWSGAEFRFLGTTASMRDVRDAARDDLHKVYVVIPLVVGSFLLIASRRPSLTVWVGVSCAFVYFAAIGLTAAIGWAWNGADFEGIDWRVPLFLFLLVFVLGHESTAVVFEAIRREPCDDSFRRLQERLTIEEPLLTLGGVAFSLAFAAMMSASVGMIRQLGLAAVIAIALNAFVIRQLSLPAFHVLVERLKHVHSPLAQIRSPIGKPGEAKRTIA